MSDALDQNFPAHQPEQFFKRHGLHREIAHDNRRALDAGTFGNTENDGHKNK